MTERLKYVAVNGTNLIVEISGTLITNARKETTMSITLPSLIDRAFMVHHESGILTVEETAEED
jgi:hypothetical protein